MNKSTITINGELNEVMHMSSIFTHGLETQFFEDLGSFEILETEVGESLNSGFFVSKTVFKSEVKPNDSTLNKLLSEFSDSRVVVVLDTDDGQWIAATDGAVAL